MAKVKNLAAEEKIIEDDTRTNADLHGFVISGDDSIFDALRKIDNNKKGFLVVADEKARVIGTVTDGDIRRAIVAGKTKEANVKEAYNSDFKFVSKKSAFDDVVDLFKTNDIEFVPVTDEEGRLFNIVTKKGMHALFLQNIHPGIDYDFLDIDDHDMDYEIFSRPWGGYKTILLNGMCQSKIIKVDPGQALSLQLHKEREEHWVIVAGVGSVILGSSRFNAPKGTHIFIPKECKHRIANVSKTETLVFVEVQIGSYFGEDDIVRFDDVYGRS